MYENKSTHYVNLTADSFIFFASKAISIVKTQVLARRALEESESMLSGAIEIADMGIRELDMKPGSPLILSGSKKTI